MENRRKQSAQRSSHLQDFRSECHFSSPEQPDFFGGYTIVITSGFIPLSQPIIVLAMVMSESNICLAIDCVVFNAVFDNSSVISRRPVHLSMLSWSFFLTSTPHNILSQPLATFQHNHCRNNVPQRERIESCRNDYHQSSGRILAKPEIEPATL